MAGASWLVRPRTRPWLEHLAPTPPRETKAKPPNLETRMFPIPFHATLLPSISYSLQSSTTLAIGSWTNETGIEEVLTLDAEWQQVTISLTFPPT